MSSGMDLTGHVSGRSDGRPLSYCHPCRCSRLVSPTNPYKTDGGWLPTCAHAVLPIVTVVPVPLVVVVMVMIMIVMVVMIVVVIIVMSMMLVVVIMPMIVMIVFPGKRSYREQRGSNYRANQSKLAKHPVLLFANLPTCHKPM